MCLRKAGNFPFVLSMFSEDEIDVMRIRRRREFKHFLQNAERPAPLRGLDDPTNSAAMRRQIEVN